MITVYSPIIVRLQIKLFSLFIPPFWKSSFWLVNSSRINGLSCIHLVPDEASSMSHRDLWGINSCITACDKDWFAAFHTLGVIIFCSCPMRDTRWCPSSLAKLVRTTPISLWFMVEISILAIVYKPTYNWGASPCTDTGRTTSLIRPLVGRRFKSMSVWQFFHGLPLKLWLGSFHSCKPRASPSCFRNQNKMTQHLWTPK